MLECKQYIAFVLHVHMNFINGSSHLIGSEVVAIYAAATEITYIYAVGLYSSDCWPPPTIIPKEGPIPFIFMLISL